jgi:hypothetical protein
MNDKGRWVASSVCLFLVIVALSGFLIKNVIDKALYNRFPDRGVARINIDLNGISLDEIKEGSKEVKYEGNDLQIYNDGEILEYGGVEVKGRGNTTWGHEKKSYQIKFSEKVDVLGMGKGKKWALLSNYIDDSFIRNDIAFTVAEMVGERCASRGEFAEVYFDGEYEGLYYLMHKIEIERYSVDIRNEDAVIFELDNIHSEDEEKYESYLENTLVLKDIISKDAEQKKIIVDNFLSDYNSFEKALENGDYERVDEIVNIDSFVEYYLINEFTVNPDAYSSSFYLYRDDDGKICAGPVWDFDFALGNKKWVWRKNDDFFLPIGKDKNVGSTIMEYLLKMSDFKEKAIMLFEKKLSGKKDLLMQTIRTKTKVVENSIRINNEKWGIGDFATDYKELLDWVEKRYEYLESMFRDEKKDIIDRKHSRFL